MKSLMPWVCLVATTSVAFATDGVDAYREGDYIKAAEQLVTASNKDPIVDYYLGRMRLYGYGQLKNNTQALHYFKQSAEKGYLPAQYLLARYALLRDKNPEQALYWFKKAADANDIKAQMYCAAAYLFGVGTKKNSEIAKRYYIAAAKNGDSIAQYALAEEFINSRQAGNKKLGLIWLNKSVEQGNPRAQLKLASLYATGNSVDKDINKAKELIRLAINQGYVPAIYQMGELARQQNELNAAKERFSQAAEKNYLPAQVALAQLYLQPKSPMYDTKVGYLLMLKAAQNGSIDAQLALADMYKNGLAVDKDENLSKEWQQKAAANGKDTPESAEIKAAQWLTNDKAISLAGSGYRLEGIFSPWQNPTAIKENIYNPAPQMDLVTRETLYKPQFVMAEPNNIAISEYYDALVNTLGSKQTTEITFPRYPVDTNYAIRQRSQLLMTDPKNLTQAAEQIEFPIVNNNAHFHLLAFLSPINPEQTSQQSMVKRLRGEAILGDPGAQFTLAQMYQSGIDVEKNIDEAIKFYELAAAQKDLPSQYNLGILYLEGRDVPANYQQALTWLNDAAFKGDAYAQYALARIYEQGYQDANGKEVIPPDPEQARAMYYLSAENEYGVAQYRLAEILVRSKQPNVSIAAKEKRNQMIKRLYQGATLGGVEEAALPLAFFNAMDPDKSKQTEAFELAKKEAGKGNGQAALLLGLMYDRGIAVPVNQVEGLYWYQQASQNPVSAFILGTYFSQGTGVNRDIQKGKALLQQSADGGFSYANFNLAIMKKQQGESFLPELDTALALGNSKAGLLLADYYLSLANDPEKMKQARDIYQHFAEKGDRDGQLKLAFMCEQGLGGQIDLMNAQKWYGLAAGQGQSVAQYLLGRFYQLGGTNQQPDYVEAKKWYGMAKTNYLPAAVALGFISDTVEDNYQQAQSDYQYAAQHQDSIGQYDLGLIYEKGKGRPVDFEQAKSLYIQAAEQGHSQAMVQLAGLYFNGLVGARDEPQALHWYKKAAELGNRDALYQLGLLSETGVATKLDFSDAVNYYQQAATKGDVKAKLALARMYQYGIGVNKDVNQAIALYKELATLDNPYAQYQLAAFYFEGTSGERKPDVGRRLLQQAQENGSQQARRALQWLNAQSQERVSFIEPAAINNFPMLAEQPADLMYLDALSEWNRGDEELSRRILDRIMTQFPQYVPAKRAYESLHQQGAPNIFG